MTLVSERGRRKRGADRQALAGLEGRGLALGDATRHEGANVDHWALLATGQTTRHGEDQAEDLSKEGFDAEGR